MHAECAGRRLRCTRESNSATRAGRSTPPYSGDPKPRPGDDMTRNARFAIDDRPSDSPFVERVWRAHSERAGTFLSVASSHCEMVVTRHRGRIKVTLRGPETRATTIE